MTNKLKKFGPALLITFGIGLSMALPAAAAQDPVRGLLIRLQMNMEGDDFTLLEHFFYRDGLVITKSILGGNPRYLRGTLAPGELGKLKALLNENRVGTIVARDCKVPSPLPSSISFQGALTWFGRNGRQNYMTFGGGDLCPDRLIILFLEIYDLDVLYTDTVTTVP